MSLLLAPIKLVAYAVKAAIYIVKLGVELLFAGFSIVTLGGIVGALAAGAICLVVGLTSSGVAA